MFSMLVDEQPVKIQGSNAGCDTVARWTSLLSGAGNIEFSDRYYGDEYLIPWYFVDNMAFSTVPLLVNISWQQLKNQGFI